MHDLRLIGVHEDGEHLLLGGEDDARFRMPVDDALRAAIRRDRPRLRQQGADVEGGLRPRDVQALIRAGASAEEAADRAGWSVDKVHRYEGPIIAEREHVAGLAQKARLHTRTGASSGGSSPTLATRVTERLKERDVDVNDAGWDASRAESGPWTVVLTFAAGGRQRQASWTFDLADRTLSAVDDEARWLSEEVQPANGPIPAQRLGSTSGRATTVYDVEAEGGLRPTAHAEHHGSTHHDLERHDLERHDLERAGVEPPDFELHNVELHDVLRPEDPLDLMSAMRKRSTARSRRRPGGHRDSARAARALPNHNESNIEQPLPLDTLIELADESLAKVDSTPHHSSPREADTSQKKQKDTAHEDTKRKDTKRKDTKQEPDERSTDRAPRKAPAKGPVRESARKSGRPSVPAWDEIMFGSKSGADRSSS